MDPLNHLHFIGSRPPRLKARNLVAFQLQIDSSMYGVRLSPTYMVRS